ncbi:hypothetical protein BDR26DRAFT_871765 [Obelidium mucronatum]|nr:hypothetical protein BDR26DRAFT_871765 [Obelidium mucronatum]
MDMSCSHCPQLLKELNICRQVLGLNALSHAELAVVNDQRRTISSEVLYRIASFTSNGSILPFCHAFGGPMLGLSRALFEAGLCFDHGIPQVYPMLHIPALVSYPRGALLYAAKLLKQLVKCNGSVAFESGDLEDLELIIPRGMNAMVQLDCIEYDTIRKLANLRLNAKVLSFIDVDEIEWVPAMNPYFRSLQVEKLLFWGYIPHGCLLDPSDNDNIFRGLRELHVEHWSQDLQSVISTSPLLTGIKVCNVTTTLIIEEILSSLLDSRSMTRVYLEIPMYSKSDLLRDVDIAPVTSVFLELLRFMNGSREDWKGQVFVGSKEESLETLLELVGHAMGETNRECCNTTNNAWTGILTLFGDVRETRWMCFDRVLEVFLCCE